MYCHMLDFKTHISGCVSKHRTYRRPRISHSACSWSCSSRPSSSVHQETNEAGNFHERRRHESRSFPSGKGSSTPAFTLANTVGILGGVSAISTLNFMEKLVKWSAADGREALPFIACNDPVLNRELSSSQRNSSPYFDPPGSRWQFNRSLIVENLKQKRLYLEKSGARCIAMPCHLSHVWYDEISEGCSVPFCHLGECVAKELGEANLKPIEAGSNIRIGVLATEAILTAGSYQEQLQNQGFEVVLPDKATIDHTINPAVKALERKDMEGARNLLRIALQVLLVRGVNTVIVASEEIIGLLPEDDPLLRKCTNPMDALARSTIQWAASTEII
ncbi:uncharacterized protein M6B38_103705 [Iris pallida]|uniref:Aspartate racemase n=1 Tax=Iris pallida TaxID=29817 RepID=A0AAX6F2M4_IRIPA|nr:uncharacterized protein M6B38_103705 [Iris pallida]